MPTFDLPTLAFGLLMWLGGMASVALALILGPLLRELRETQTTPQVKPWTPPTEAQKREAERIRLRRAQEARRAFYSEEELEALRQDAERCLKVGEGKG